MRVFILVAAASLSACSWIAPKKAPIPDPTQIVVTGAPVNSSVFIDGSQISTPATLNGQPQVFDVAAGDHKVEIHVGDSVAYREDVYVAPSQHRVVRVLSGLN